MPELPEVQTTVNGLNEEVIDHYILDVWTTYNSKRYHGSDTIKDPRYFTVFKKRIIGRKIVGASRRAKNILIHLDGKNTILIHMKMTGHMMVGSYEMKEDSHPLDPWKALDHGPLQDPFNRHIRLVFTLKKGTAKKPVHLVLSDMRKFAKVTLIDTKKLHESEHLRGIGPEPLEKSFTFDLFLKRLALKPHGKIKPTIMDQSVIAGVGNIYADESLWRAGIHPESRVSSLPRLVLKKLYTSIRATLEKGIDFGGDSMSDYRNIHGERGSFQETHRAYRKTGTRCEKRGCNGTIIRKVIAGRSGHFCSVHQKMSV